MKKYESHHVYFWAALVSVVVTARTASANPLAGLVSKIDDFNSALITLGIALTVTGFIMACIAAKFGKGSVAGAMTILGLGVAISFSKQIVSFLTSGIS